MLDPSKTVLGIPLPTCREVSPLSTETLSGTDRLHELTEAEEHSVLDVVRLAEAEDTRSDARLTIAKASLAEMGEKYIPLSITDQKTLDLIEFASLIDPMMDRCSTAAKVAIAGAALRPSTSEAIIHAKQEAYKELLENRELLNAFTRFERHWNHRLENKLFKFAIDGWDFRNDYFDYWKVRGAVLSLCRVIDKCPEPKSPYLRMLVEDMKELRNSRFATLLEGTIFRTTEGLKTAGEVQSDPSVKKPVSKFLPWTVTPTVVLLSVPLMAASLFAGYGLYNATRWLDRLADPHLAAKYSFGLFFGGLFYLLANGTIIGGIMRGKREHDEATVARPLEALAFEDDKLENAIDAAGKIGELVAGVKFIRKARVPLIFPDVHEASHHYMIIKGMGSPLFWTDPAYVTSDIKLCDHSLMTLTGPNSGGKTTAGRALLLIQLLSQMGLPISALEASIGIADWVGYQAPIFDSQKQVEGRFGTTFTRTKEISMPARKRGFAVFDELGEGATHDEGTLRSREVLEMLVAKESTAVVITHNLDLARILQELGLAESIQVEFDKGSPTHRIIAGIATSSHSEEVAARVGFSRDVILEHLRDVGVVGEDQSPE